LVSFIKVRDIQVLHAHPTAVPLAVAIGRTLGLPVVATYHGFFGWRWDMHGVLAKLICISLQVYDQLKSDPNLAGKLVVIQNGIDIDIFKPVRLPSDGRKILFIGRLDADKYYSLKIIIEALAAIPGVELLVAGPGAYYDQLKAEAPSWVKCLGFVRDMPALINEAGIVIGTGRGVREAMACGIPAIALDACGYDGLVTPETINALEYGNFMGRSGRPLNADNLLHDLSRVIDHPETRAAIGVWSRKYAEENYAITPIALKHLLVYKEVTDRISSQ
jgi:glycosyltransferase involved in cell wall biosynthesis